MKITTLGFILALLLVYSPQQALAQSPIQCGTILEAELTVDNDEHLYLIDLAPGDTVHINTQKIGQSLELKVILLDPTLHRVAISSGGTVNLEPTVSSTGVYTIQIDGLYSSDFGAYTLRVGCTLRNGAIISPGDIISSNPISNEVVTVNTFSGYGFPGLAPVEFAAPLETPLITNQVNNLAMASGVTNTAIAYTYEASAGSTGTLSIKRAAGEMPLGVVVINKSNNSIVFMSGLVSTNSVLAEIVFPSNDVYAIGFFSLSLPNNPANGTGLFEFSFNH